MKTFNDAIAAGFELQLARQEDGKVVTTSSMPTILHHFPREHET